MYLETIIWQPVSAPRASHHPPPFADLPIDYLVRGPWRFTIVANWNAEHGEWVDVRRFRGGADGSEWHQYIVRLITHFAFLPKLEDSGTTFLAERG
jgi:hypothetical protein